MEIKISKLLVPFTPRNKRIYQGNNSTSATVTSSITSTTGESHNQIHDVNSPADHKPALADDYDKIIGTNATTGAIEFVTKLWKKVGSVISPKSASDELQVASEKIGDIAGGNYHHFNSVRYRMVGETTVWKEMKVSMNELKLGSANLPTMGAFLGSLQLLYFSATATNEVFFTIPLPWDWKEGTDLYPVVRWVAGASSGSPTRVRWGLEYYWHPQGSTGSGVPPVLYTTDQSPAENPIGFRRYKSPFAAISGADKVIESVLVCRLFRDGANGADTFAGTAGIEEFTIAYEVDAIGADAIYTKTTP